jgi:hypothetical protein
MTHKVLNIFGERKSYVYRFSLAQRETIHRIFAGSFRPVGEKNRQKKKSTMLPQARNTLA